MLTEAACEQKTSRTFGAPPPWKPLLSGSRLAVSAALLWLGTAWSHADGPTWIPMTPPTPAPQLVQAPQPVPAEKQAPLRQPGGDSLPPPRVIEGFRPGQERLPRLGGAGPLGTTPVPTEQDLAEQRRYVQELVDPHNVLDLIINRTRVLVTKETPRRVQMGDEHVATYNILSPNEIALIGQQVNTTVLNLWFPDPQDPKKDKILSYLIRVLPDPEVKERLERTYKALQDEINNAFPDSLICLFLVGDKLVVTGQAKDIAESTEILRLITANAPAGAGGTGQAVGTPQGIPVNSIQPTSYNPGDPNAPNGLPGLNNFLIAGAPNVVNLIRVPGEQQVMLKVMVAEVNRAAARSIGVNFSVNTRNGLPVFSQLSGNLFNQGFGGFGFGGGGNSALGLGGIGAGTGAGAATGGLAGGGFGSLANNLPINFGNGLVPFAINALRNMNYARSLAEPNLVTLNGQPASFFAGGQFPIPVISGFTAAGLQGVSFVPFGVQLTFTPYVSDKDRIRLSVRASVSTRNENIGSSFGGGGLGGGGFGGGLGGALGGLLGGVGGLGGLGGGGAGFVSGLNSRTFQTTVELREGQTLAVAGLIQNSLGADATRVPFFGDLPFIGRFFAYDRTSHSEQELVVLVTPELVHPLEPKECPPLPGADIFEPGDLEFYFLGRLESRRTADYRSSVRTDIARMAAYRHCEDIYILGPHGPTDAPPAPAVPLKADLEGQMTPVPPPSPAPGRFLRPPPGPPGGPYLPSTPAANP